MTHRERFCKAVSHQPVDRAVFDLCGSPQTYVDSPEVKARLGEILGFTGPWKGNYCVDERILEAFDIDTRHVGGMPPMPATRHRRAENGVTYNDWGIGFRGVADHWEMCHYPLKDATADTIMAYEFPDPDRIDMSAVQRWADEAAHLQRTTDYAVVAEHPVFGVMEIGCWLFGYDDYLYRLAAEPETMHAFARRFYGHQKKVIEKYYGALGPYIDCTTSGDDFGTQTGPFMSTAMFDEFVTPYMRDRVELTKKFTGAFYQHHTCGSVHNFIPSLIACKVDVINPIQPGVYMMEHDRLKKDYGAQMAFWGGVDTQHLLPRGTVAEVKAEVGRILSIMDHDGGYILSPAHTIQRDVPAENVIAVYEGAKEFYK
ncbi:MAG: methyltransferase [Kiritimatiellaeota bacterium]|nr:methyltransferase [Kiritimatiellota bacterium]